MSSDKHKDDPVYQQIIEELNVLIEMGLVEITGITDDGEWLYGLTPNAKKISEGVDKSNSGWMNDVIDAIVEQNEDKE